MDLARPADQDLYLTQLPSYEYRDLVAMTNSIVTIFFALRLCSLISRVRRNDPRGPDARLTEARIYSRSALDPDISHTRAARTPSSKNTSCGLSTIVPLPLRFRFGSLSPRARVFTLSSPYVVDSR